jgi:asparagine synthase (glutamine-hydrolysing)
MCGIVGIAHADSRQPVSPHELRGMFAFAIWDAAAQRLFLARDRFGIKPLYVASGPWGVAFASELKALGPALPAGHGGELDWNALDMYFQLGYIPAPATPFRDVIKRPPGHTALWSRTAGLTTREYWDLSGTAFQRRRRASWKRNWWSGSMSQSGPIS